MLRAQDAFKESKDALVSPVTTKPEIRRLDMLHVKSGALADPEYAETHWSPFVYLSVSRSVDAAG